MNSRLISACALAGIALTVFGASSATAEEVNKGSMGFIGNTLGRGETVEINGSCDDPNFTSAPVVSDVLDMPDLSGTDDGAGGYLLTSTGKVKDDAAYGTWPVHFMCGTTKVETTFTVVGSDAPAPPAQTDAPAPPPAQIPVTPKGAADTGSLDAAPDQDSNTGVLALGGLAVLAAGGLLAYRKRQKV